MAFGKFAAGIVLSVSKQATLPSAWTPLSVRLAPTTGRMPGPVASPTWSDAVATAAAGSPAALSGVSESGLFSGAAPWTASFGRSCPSARWSSPWIVGTEPSGCAAVGCWICQPR